MVEGSNSDGLLFQKHTWKTRSRVQLRGYGQVRCIVVRRKEHPLCALVPASMVVNGGEQSVKGWVDPV